MVVWKQHRAVGFNPAEQCIDVNAVNFTPQILWMSTPPAGHSSDIESLLELRHIWDSVGLDCGSRESMDKAQHQDLHLHQTEQLNKTLGAW